MSISERKHVSEGEAPARRVEIFTGAGRRRIWTAQEKAAIVAESFEDGVLACHVARRHGLTPQQLFTWRREARRKAGEETNAPTFVPAIVEAQRTDDPEVAGVEPHDLAAFVQPPAVTGPGPAQPDRRQIAERSHAAAGGHRSRHSTAANPCPALEPRARPTGSSARLPRPARDRARARRASRARAG